MQATLKILVIQFKSLGDAVLMVPALKAVRDHFPDSQLHVLVSEQAAPLLQNLPWINRVWIMPRIRGRARVKQNWPIIRALRAERFDRSVDFAGNDRGAVLSLLCGARERLGLDIPGFFGKRFCFTRCIAPVPADQHAAWRNFHVLSVWQIVPPSILEITINSAPALAGFAKTQLPEKKIICHMGAGMPKKQWPVRHWAAFYQQASAAGFKLAFTAGENQREKTLAADLKKIIPSAQILPPFSIAEFLAVLSRAQALVTGDTGPMHFAAALGVPLVALFGATSLVLWKPITKNCRILTGAPCTCAAASHDCHSASHCMDSIAPDQVLAALQKMFPSTSSTFQA
ncbi:MAG: glycosyltransferase family 9 protein [Verrucomicrobiota bacterium]